MQIIKNESIQQLPTKTPEKTIEKKNTRVNMISDHRDDESEQHKSKRMKQSRPKEQERDPYGSIRVNKGMTMLCCLELIFQKKKKKSKKDFKKSVHVKSLMN